jgi:hypothetical protein
MIEIAKRWARDIKNDVVALYIVGRDPRTPWYAKAVALAVAAYAISPIDLIPDFIPVTTPVPIGNSQPKTPESSSRGSTPTARKSG